MKVAIVSNGNLFATAMVRPLFDAADVTVAGVVLVRVPPGKGGRAGRLWRLSRKTGFRFARHKFGTLVLPRLYGTVRRSPVFLGALASRRGVPARDLESVNSDEARAFLEGLGIDVLLSVSCPQRIAPEVLSIPRVAAINVHWALLPAYGGIAPYFWVLLRGETRTGVTVHVMEPDIDVGPILRQREVPVGADDTTLRLQVRLAQAGGEEVLSAIRELPGSLERATAQDPSGRSYFSWPSARDVAGLYAGGHRLARWRDYRAAFALIGKE